MPRKLIAALFAALLVLAACGDDDGDVADTDTDPTVEDDTGTTDDTSSDPTTADGAADAPVTTSDTDLGEILVDSEGFTLYGFTADSPGTPTCTDDCAATWPPATVDSEELPEGLDPEVFSVVEHPSGDFMLQAGDWPLYTYAPDTAPGDTTGQGVGGVWYVVSPEGELIEE